MNGEQERRKYVRVPFSAGLTITSISGQQTCSGNSINLSRGGIGLYCEKFFPTGTRLMIQVEMHYKGRVIKDQLSGTVRWAKIEQDGAILGVEFDELLNPTKNNDLCNVLDSK